MPRKPIDVFTEGEVDRLAEGVFTVLERAGAMYQSPALLAALQAAGARVDPERQRAFLPRGLVEQVLESQRRRRGADSVGPRNRCNRPSPTGPLPGVGLQVAQFYYDHERDERRPGTRADLERMVHLGDALGEGPVDQVLIMREEPVAVEPLEALLVILEHTARPGAIYPHFAGQFPYLEEIGEIVCGDANRFLTGGIFMVPPLRMDERACGHLEARARRGLPISVGTMPVSGVSAPVTRAGAIVTGAADIIAGWVAAAALEPQVPVSGSICSGSVDMRTGDVSFSSPESLLQDVGCVELFRRRLGGGVGVAGGSDYTSARFPGFQAGFEKAWEALAVAIHTGGHPHVGAGLLESGKTFSPLQLFIDRECQRMLWRYAAGVEVTPEELGLEAILAVCEGKESSHLGTEHTLKHFRRSLWSPALFDYEAWHPDREEAHPDVALLERARREYGEVLARYKPPKVDRDMLARVREVVARARRELLG